MDFMESESRSYAVLTNVFLPSMPEEIGIYLALGLCGLSIIFLALHVQRKFVRASSALTTLTREWEDAQARFFKIAEAAQQQIGSLDTEPSLRVSRPEPNGEISFGLRNQVSAMGKNGATADEIARTAGLSEAEVSVLLGMSRVEGGKK